MVNLKYRRTKDKPDSESSDTVQAKAQAAAVKAVPKVED